MTLPSAGFNPHVPDNRDWLELTRGVLAAAAALVLGVVGLFIGTVDTRAAEPTLDRLCSLLPPELRVQTENQSGCFATNDAGVQVAIFREASAERLKQNVTNECLSGADGARPVTDKYGDAGCEHLVPGDNNFIGFAHGPVRVSIYSSQVGVQAALPPIAQAIDANLDKVFGARPSPAVTGALTVNLGCGANETPELSCAASIDPRLDNADLAFEWTIDGRATSAGASGRLTLPGEGESLFAGVYTIGVTVTDRANNLQGTDSLSITVPERADSSGPVAPAPAAPLSVEVGCFWDEQGRQATCRATASGGPAGVDTAFAWFADGTPVAGDTASVSKTVGDGYHQFSVRATAGTEQASATTWLYVGLIGQVTSLVTGGETSDPVNVVDHVSGLGGVAVTLGLLGAIAASLDFLGRTGTQLPGSVARPGGGVAPGPTGIRQGDLVGDTAPGMGTDGSGAGPPASIVNPWSGRPLTTWKPGQYGPGENGIPGNPGDVLWGGNWLPPDEVRARIAESLAADESRAKASADHVKHAQKASANWLEKRETELKAQAAAEQEQRTAQQTLDQIQTIARGRGMDDIWERTMQGPAIRPDGTINTEYVGKLRQTLKGRIREDMVTPLPDEPRSPLSDFVSSSFDDLRNSRAARIVAGVATGGTSEIAFQASAAWDAMQQAAATSKRDIDWTDAVRAGMKQLGRENLPLNTLEAIRDPKAGVGDVLWAGAMDVFTGVQLVNTARNLRGSIDAARSGGGAMKALTHRADPISLMGRGEDPARWPGAQLPAEPYASPRATARGFKAYEDVPSDLSINARWFGKKLPEHEQLAIRRYTGPSYGPVNDGLRATRGTATPEGFEDIIDGIDSAIYKSPGVDRNMVVFRKGAFGSETHDLSTLKPGQIITDHGYTSTAVTRSMTDMNIEIRVPQGTKGVYVKHLSSWPDENELLLGRGTKFKVLQVGSRIVMEVVT